MPTVATDVVVRSGVGRASASWLPTSLGWPSRRRCCSRGRLSIGTQRVTCARTQASHRRKGRAIVQMRSANKSMLLLDHVPAQTQDLPSFVGLKSMRRLTASLLRPTTLRSSKSSTRSDHRKGASKRLANNSCAQPRARQNTRRPHTRTQTKTHLADLPRLVQRQALQFSGPPPSGTRAAVRRRLVPCPSKSCQGFIF